MWCCGVQGGIVGLNFLALLGMVVIRQQSKAQLNRTKGIFFLVTYFIVLTVLAVLTFMG